MLRFLYTGDYDDPQRPKRGLDATDNAIFMFWLAQRFEVPHLKALALSRLARYLDHEHNLNCRHFIQTLKMIHRRRGGWQKDELWGLMVCAGQRHAHAIRRYHPQYENDLRSMPEFAEALATQSSQAPCKKELCQRG